MKLKQILIYILIIASIQLVYADDKSIINSQNLKIDYSNNQIYLTHNSAQISSLFQIDDWIKTRPVIAENNTSKFNYSITSNHGAIGNEVSFAWSLNNFFSVSLNVYENQILADNNFNNSNSYLNNKSYNKIAATTVNSGNEFNINRSISGYTFGIASEVGLGNNFKLGLNLDYGQLDGASLIGFQNNEVTTTSFAVGIRKSRFGASVNTDLYLEENIDFMNNTRFGIEFDWYFTDNTTISLGTKQRINNTPINNSSSLDSLTGSVQYIKFQHNL